MGVVLYHFPPSPYSARARIALEEKGVPWEGRICNLLTMENYAPWYVRLHPGAVVPLLVDGDQVVPESDRILRFIDEHYDGPTLIPEENESRACMERWFERAQRFPLEEIHASLQPAALVRTEARALAGRAKHLRRLAREHPDLAERYERKAAHMEARHDDANAPRARAETLAFVEHELDALEEALAAGRPFLAGATYTLADVMWTVVLARLGTMRLSDSFALERRPHTSAWWARMRARPSFARADVWVRLKPLSLARFVLPLVAPKLAVAVMVIAAIVAVWMFRGCTPRHGHVASTPVAPGSQSPITSGGAAPITSSSTIAPRLFFTDLVSGPSSGGEGGLGVFVTLHGERFGATRETSTVTLGGTEVAKYVSWAADGGVARKLDRIVVQLGPSASSGDLVVTVGGRPSNPLRFTVRPGKIFCVAADAANAKDTNAGGYDAPWKTLWKPRSIARAGDVVYFRGGTFDKHDPTYAGWDGNLVLDGEHAVSGTVDAPIAYVGHPGAPPTIGDPAARRGILVNQEQGAIGHYVFSNLIFTKAQSALPISGAGHRIVGNYFHHAGREPTGVIGVEASTGLRVYGNLLADNGDPGIKFHHGFYLGGFGTIRDVDFGWNEIRDQHGGRAIQMFGHAKGDLIDDVRIHDNVIASSELNAVLIGGSDGGSDVIGTVKLFGNVIRNAGAEGVRINDPQGTVVVQSNTIVGNAVAQVLVERVGTGRLRLESNILVASGGATYVAFEPGGATPAAIVARANLWFGSGAAPSYDPSAVAAAPGFRDQTAFGFQLAVGSAAIDRGIDTEHRIDFLGVPRPVGPAFDVGAFEHAPHVRVEQ